MDLPNWENRSWVSASMLNPALIASIVVAAAEGHEYESDDPMPWELAFLVPPMVLHRDTREALPTRITSHAAKWVNAHASLLAAFPQRVTGMLPYTREGLRYALRSGAATLSGAHLRGEGSWKLDKKRSPELALLITQAAFLGRWFAKTGSSTTVYALFGVAP